MAASVERAPPASVAEDDAVVLKGAERKLSFGTCPGVNVGVAEMAGLEGLGNPVVEAVGLGGGSGSAHRSW